MPPQADPSTGRRRVPIQGFRLLYAVNDSPYESGQWTTYDVGPVEMSIISHLDTLSPYLIRVRSRGPDGQFGEWSNPVVARVSSTAGGSGRGPGDTTTDYSVRALLCSGGDASVKVTWQRPIKTEALMTFNVSGFLLLRHLYE